MASINFDVYMISEHEQGGNNKKIQRCNDRCFFLYFAVLLLQADNML